MTFVGCYWDYGIGGEADLRTIDLGKVWEATDISICDRR